MDIKEGSVVKLIGKKRTAKVVRFEWGGFVRLDKPLGGEVIWSVNDLQVANPQKGKVETN